MYRHLHHGLSIAVFLLLSLLFQHSLLSADTSEDDQKSEWDALVADLDTIDELLADPTQADSGEDKTRKDSFFFLTSFGTGYGFSDNFLKRHDAVSSAYYRFESDLWFNWTKGNSSLMGLFFAEAIRYEEDYNASDEYLAFGLLTWKYSMDSIEIGTDLKGMVAEQIFDASLPTITVPLGTSIYQESPEVDVFLDWFPGYKDKFRLEAGVRRSEFDLEDENYWEPSIGIEWEHAWKFSIETKTKVGYSRQFYDDDVIRDPRGNSLSSDQLLEIDTFTVFQQIRWKPDHWQWFQLNLIAGISPVVDLNGKYEELLRSWASINTSLKFKWGQMRLSAKWVDLDYKWRWSDYLNPVPARNIQRSINAEIVKPLPWNLELLLRGKWLINEAKHVDDIYEETRGEFIITWSY